MLPRNFSGGLVVSNWLDDPNTTQPLFKGQGRYQRIRLSQGFPFWTTAADGSVADMLKPAR
jgi:hypothetical protein